MRVLSGRESFAPAVVVEGLRVRFDARDGQKEVLSGASLTVHTGRVTCLVGASGSGKSVLTKALLGVLPGTPGVVAGRVRLEVPGVGHVEVLEGLSGCVTVGDDHWRVRRRWRRVLRRRMRPLWGRVLGYVPQDWSRALDPTRPVGTSLGEAMVASLGPEAGHRAARKRERPSSPGSGSRDLTSSGTSTRTSSRGEWHSGCRSLFVWLEGRRQYSPTNRQAVWTEKAASRFSSCWRSCIWPGT